jgi:cytochrome c oxidase subunit 2
MPSTADAAVNELDLGSASALDPAGLEAARVAGLFWLMLAGGLLVWLLTLALTLYAAYGRRPARARRRRAIEVVILGGGLVLPALLLAVLLVQGLRTLAQLQDRPEHLQIAVTAERYWWRVEYRPGDGGGAVVLANEIRLPVGRHARLHLSSREVIHSLWIPALAGKLDMLPGRDTRLLLSPTRSGRYRGLCAEYCGIGHAKMSFTVEVMPPEAFDQWLQAQRLPAAAPATPTAGEGARLFAAYGCPACHTVRGTGANGRIGPNLTHLGARPTLAAMDLPMNAASLQRWVRNPAQLKPGALMPAFELIPEHELSAIAHYLEGLR